MNDPLIPPVLDAVESKLPGQLDATRAQLLTAINRPQNDQMAALVSSMSATLTELRAALSDARIRRLDQIALRRCVRFTDSGVFTPPPGVEWVYVILYGAGGGSSMYCRRTGTTSLAYYWGTHGGVSAFGDITAEGGFASIAASKGGAGGGKSPRYAATDSVIAFRGSGTGPFLASACGLDGFHTTGTYAPARLLSISGGGSYARGGIFADDVYTPPLPNGGGGGGASLIGLDLVSGATAYTMSGGGGEIAYGIVPVSGPVEVLIGRGGVGGSIDGQGGYAGANGGCIVMF